MNRRRFLSILGGASIGMALEEAIPLGRVWSFPKQIKVVHSLDELNTISLKYVNPVLCDDVFKTSPLFIRLRDLEHTVNIHYHG